MAEKKDLSSFFQPARTPGDLIKAFRKNFDISQDEMALGCGINQANLSAIENGSRPVGPSVALKLAAFMGLNPEIILYPGGFEAEPEYQVVRGKSQVLRSGEVPYRKNSEAELKSARSLVPKSLDAKEIWAYIKRQRLEREIMELGAQDLMDLAKKTHDLIDATRKASRRPTKKSGR